MNEINNPLQYLGKKYGLIPGSELEEEEDGMISKEFEGFVDVPSNDIRIDRRSNILISPIRIYFRDLNAVNATIEALLRLRDRYKENNRE